MHRSPNAHTGVLIACVIMLTLNSGLGFYALATFTAQQVVELEVPLGAAALGASGFVLGEGVGGIIVARLARRYPVHKIIMVGGLATSVQLAILGQVRSPVLIVATFTFYGLAASAFHQVPASILVIRYFRHPARPIAIVMTGLSAGGCVVTPFLTYATESIGLAKACLAAALILAVAVVGVSHYLRRHVAEFRSVRSSTSEPAAQPLEGVTETRFSRLALLTVCIAFGLLLLTCVGAIAHLALLSQERGIDHVSAVIAGMSGMALMGRFLMIPAFRHWRLTQVTVVLGLLGSLSMASLTVSFNLPTLMAASLLVGVVSGNYTSLVPLWTLRVVGRGHFGSYFARTSFITMALAALGPGVVAALHHQFGSYTGATAALVLIATLATLALVVTGRMQTRNA